MRKVREGLEEAVSEAAKKAYPTRPSEYAVPFALRMREASAAA
jgi:hypothetical protein